MDTPGALTTPPIDPNLATDADVYHAYRLFLGREPDEDGFAHYRRLVSTGLSLEALAQAFTRSGEHRRRETRIRNDHQDAVDLGGYRVVIDRRDPDFGADIAHWRVYEEPVRQALRDRLGTGQVCVDVGANVGVMTLLAAALVGPTGRVIAVEPNPDNVQLLYQGIVLNRFHNVEVLPLAAADRFAVLSMSDASNTILDTVPEDDSATRYVQSVVLDDRLRELSRLDLIKLDIEGYELVALRGLERSVARHRPTLVVEFNPRCLERQGHEPADLLSWLLERYPQVRAVSQFGDDRCFRGIDELMAFWQHRAAEVAAEGKLPPGLLHLDLVAEADRPAHD